MIQSDYLPNTNFQILQDDTFYHFNSDTTLLGEFIQLKHKDRVLDIGCNTGALLLYASRFQPSLLCGIDLFEEVIELAKKNMELNGVEAELHVCDVKEFEHDLFDVIISNPPYFNTKEESLKNENPYLEAARHETYLSLDTLFSNVNRLLKDQGTFYMVHRPQRLLEILLKAHTFGLSIQELQIVYKKVDSKPRSVLLKFKKSINTELKILEPLYI